ncbi:MAG: agmatinase [Thermoguttaceae bacterium]|jgi:agmatinase
MSPIVSGQFLGVDSVDKDGADALILPLPYEKTVSYGSGTSNGPRAILDASLQLELFDEETLVDFKKAPKLHTLPALLDCGAETVQDYLRIIETYVAPLRDRFVLGLGGEHTVTYGLVKGLAGDPAEVTIVQIDAHADLIDELNGLKWSHGTVMRRLWEEGCRLLQIGIRSLSSSEYELADSGERITTYFAHRLEEQWAEVLRTLHDLEGAVYLTIDVDGLDPSIIPSTGTPQPGGLSWRQAMEVIRAIATSRGIRWLGADVVEFVPSPHPPGCDPAAARLAEKVLAWRHWGRRG